MGKNFTKNFLNRFTNWFNRGKTEELPSSELVFKISIFCDPKRSLEIPKTLHELAKENPEIITEIQEKYSFAPVVGKFISEVIIKIGADVVKNKIERFWKSFIKKTHEKGILVEYESRYEIVKTMLSDKAH